MFVNLPERFLAVQVLATGYEQCFVGVEVSHDWVLADYVELALSIVSRLAMFSLVMFLENVFFEWRHLISADGISA